MSNRGFGRTTLHGLPHVLIRIPAGLLLLFSIVCLLGPDLASAQKAQRPFGKVVNEWNQVLDLIGREVGGVELSAPRAETLKERLAAIEAEARQFKTTAEAEIISGGTEPSLSAVVSVSIGQSQLSLLSFHVLKPPVSRAAASSGRACA